MEYDKPSPGWVRSHADLSGSTRYFQLKSCYVGNIFTSCREGIWATTPKNTLKLLDAYLNSDNVILVFSVNSSKKFYGYARMASMPHESLSVGHFGNMEQTFLGPCFRVHWINNRHIPFDRVNEIKNTLNDNLSVRICRDGQEVDKEAGMKLCEEMDAEFNKWEKNQANEELNAETLSNSTDNSEGIIITGKQRKMLVDLKPIKKKKLDY